MRPSRSPVLLLALTLLGCTSRSSPSPADGAPVAPERVVVFPRSKTGVVTASEADQVIAAGGQPVVQLLDAGQEPRRART